MIKLTEDAANQIMAQIKASGSEHETLRIAVTKHDKSIGFQYLMGFDTQKEGDSLYEVRGVKLLVNNDLLDVMNGMEIDFVEIEGEDWQFIFKNPNDPNYKSPVE
ncbi:MAG: iron-sulfur cluster assembly accessory protein [Gammaproteobacteria bacterium]|nr:iron-sulfur cluster assembly accessory protein [Gammaproteobacteria bacterium]